MKKFLEEYLKFIRNLANQKILVLLGAFSTLIALLIILSFTNERLNYSLNETYNIPIANERTLVLFISLAFGSFALIYLQSGGKKSKNDDEQVSDYNERRINNLTNELSELKSLIKTIKAGYNFNSDDKYAIKEQVISNLTSESINKIFESKISEIKSDLENQSGFTKVLDSSYEIIFRLKREIKDLRLRANINLVFGLIITFGGLWLLWNTVNIIDSSELLKQLASEGNESNYKFLKNLFIPIVPRILLILFIEIFSYFFLKLYKQGLSEIKFFQNELTNIESKIAAVSFSFVTNEKETLRRSIDSLSNTERNMYSENNKNSRRTESDKDLLNKLSDLVNKLVKNDG